MKISKVQYHFRNFTHSGHSKVQSPLNPCRVCGARQLKLGVSSRHPSLGLISWRSAEARGTLLHLVHHNEGDFQTPKSLPSHPSPYLSNDNTHTHTVLLYMKEGRESFNQMKAGLNGTLGPRFGFLPRLGRCVSFRLPCRPAHFCLSPSQRAARGLLVLLGSPRWAP